MNEPKTSRNTKKQFHEAHGDAVIVPAEFKPIFDAAQNIVCNFFKEIDADPAKGTIEIGGDRYLLVSASALSVNFLESIANLYADRGHEEAFAIGKNFLFDVAHLLGMNDARNFHAKTGLKEPMYKLSAGPIYFAHTGWALVDILPQSRPSADRNFFLTYRHPFSFEADSWLKAGKTTNTPVCIMNAGYSSGWCEESFGIPLTAVEVACRAKGDENCTFIMAPPDRIKEHLGKYLAELPVHIRERVICDIPTFFERKQAEELLKLQKNIALKLHSAENSKETLGDVLDVLLELEGVDCGGVYEYDEASASLQLVTYRGLSREFIGRASYYDSNSPQYKIVAKGAPSFWNYGIIAEKVSVDIVGVREGLKSIAIIPLMHNKKILACYNIASHTVEKFPESTRRIIEGITPQIGDILARKKAEDEKMDLEEQLQRVQKMEAIGTLAGGIAHDFNNFLAIIQGYLGIIDAKLSNPENNPATLLKEIRSYVGPIMETTECAARLVQQMMTFSRKREYEKTVCDVCDILEGTAAHLIKAGRSSIKFSSDYAPGLSSIMADKGQIEQALLNIFVNAADAMPGGGSLEVRAENYMGRPGPLEHGRYVLITIKDNGMGMTPEVSAQIFNPFFTTKEVGKGTGFGLSTTYSIITGHGGHIECDSVLGHGTTFKIYLPASSALPERSLPKKAEMCFDGTGTILIVDDEPYIRSMVASILEDAGYAVMSAADGREAVNVYQEHKDKIDLVILDATMPNLSGRDAQIELQKINPGIKSILSSGYDLESAEGYQDIGVVAFVPKPYKREALLKTVMEAMNAPGSSNHR